MVLKIAFMALVLFLSTAGASEQWNDSNIGYVADSNDGVVFLYTIKCPASISKYISPKIRTKFQYARISTPTGSIDGCWMDFNKQWIFLFWQDGAYGVMKQGAFNVLKET